MNRAERRQAVVADLALVEWIQRRIAALPVRCLIRFGVGDREIRLTADGPPPKKLYECFEARLSFPHEEVKAAVERSLGSLGSSSKSSSPSTS
jgi:hypothetical protein